ncbi:hypothetical protein [Nocardia grenadensis]|uniref:hypothetical protein n=1 Tax=Nocardia grenadensis TaxID=931537 RepID=UPI003D738C69
MFSKKFFKAVAEVASEALCKALDVENINQVAEIALTKVVPVVASAVAKKLEDTNPGVLPIINKVASVTVVATR